MASLEKGKKNDCREGFFGKRIDRENDEVTWREKRLGAAVSSTTVYYIETAAAETAAIQTK